MGAVNAISLHVAATMGGFAIRSAMAAICLFAAFHALHNRDDFAKIVQANSILPDAVGEIFAALLPPMQCVIAVALVVPGTRFLGSYAALAMLVCFTFAIAINLVRGRRDIACGCGGGAGQTISWALVLRNALLMGGLAASLAAPSHQHLEPAAIIGIAGLSSFLAVLYLAANQLMVNAMVSPRSTAGAHG
jgi:hypothetical protein